MIGRGLPTSRTQEIHRGNCGRGLRREVRQPKKTPALREKTWKRAVVEDDPFKHDNFKAWERENRVNGVSAHVFFGVRLKDPKASGDSSLMDRF
jgi:hypothetical protein